MKHHHHHNHAAIKADKESSDTNLLISTLLNLIISLVEIIGGLISNSLALISDALHNLGDTSALFIAYVANLISKKDHNHKKTYGYKRIEILAALFNAVILVVIIVYIFIEAWHRLFDPKPVKGLVMFVVAFTGLIANLISVLLLHKHSHRNINIRSAYLHLFGDTVSSVVVIISSVLIYFYEIFWIDPVVTFLLGLYLLKATFNILKESFDILMQGTPSGLSLIAVKKELESLPEIDNIHHVHVWNMNDHDIHFECHIDLKKDLRISETESVKDSISQILHEKFGISHITVQYEYNCCEDKDIIHKR